MTLLVTLLHSVFLSPFAGVRPAAPSDNLNHGVGRTARQWLAINIRPAIPDDLGGSSRAERSAACDTAAAGSDQALCRVLFAEEGRRTMSE
eukprot:6181336-Pleurochrysis_carterae.AAC.2